MTRNENRRIGTAIRETLGKVASCGTIGRSPCPAAACCGGSVVSTEEASAVRWGAGGKTKAPADLGESVRAALRAFGVRVLRRIAAWVEAETQRSSVGADQGPRLSGPFRDSAEPLLWSRGEPHLKPWSYPYFYM
jgi:hypothetical protein